VTRAGELIDVLNARAGARIPRERTTGLPYGWALWIKARAAAMAGRQLPVRADDVVALLGAGDPRPRERGEELGPFGALLSLFRQGWLPPPPEERPLRVASWGASALLHVGFFLLLAWIAYLQSLLPPPPDPTAAGGGGARVGVGFVSRGDAGQGAGGPATPVPATDGAAPPAAANAPTVPGPVSASGAPDTPAVAASAAIAEQVSAAAEVEPAVQPAPTPVPEDPLIVAPALQVPAREVAVRAAEPALREREVTVVQAPAIVAPRPREIDIPLPVAPQPRLAVREVAVVEAPEVRPRLAPEVRAPEARTPDLRQREVAEPLPAVERAATAVAVPQVQPRAPAAPTLRQREVPMPAGGERAPPVPGSGVATAPPVPSGATPGPSVPSPLPADADRQGAASNPQSGRPAPPGPAPGSSERRPADAAPAGDPWARALADDRWGPAGDTGARNPGLFDGDGRARLPGSGAGAGQGPGRGPGEGVAERGAPGGANDAWSRERIDQSGTWLKRPPYDYEPTSFDRYWMPNQSLLAEWVRKGIQNVAIPIPGSNGKKLNCVVSLLQLGGGCGISDDNLNEQPAVARPPPDIPFKPELQEDNGSVRPPG